MTTHRPIPRAAPGFAVIEAVISSLIIGLMIATSVQLVGASRSSQAWSANRVRAHELAAALLAEITDRRYSDPDLPGDVIGPGADEGAGRTVYDDVDDYDNLSESPPRKQDNTVIPGHTGWTRSVEIEWVTLADLSQTSITSTGIKRITVTITQANRKLAELVSIRTNAVNR